MEAEPRTLASYDVAARQWRIAAGSYQVSLARAADAIEARAQVELPAATLAIDCPDAMPCTAPAP